MPSLSLISTGSLGYETQDADQYAAWGVDYLKYDDCYNENIPDIIRYTTMGKALNATGIFLLFVIVLFNAKYLILRATYILFLM